MEAKLVYGKGEKQFKGDKRQKRLCVHGIVEDYSSEGEKTNLDHFPRLWSHGKLTFRVMRDFEIRIPDDK